MGDAVFHLAEFNISRLAAPLDDPGMKEFVDFLDPVNAFAEQSPGFLRLANDGRRRASGLVPALAVRGPDDLTNLTLWTDLETLRAFAYQTVHRYFLQSRRKWFERVESRQLVLWWVPAGRLPTLDEAKRKLSTLEECGPTAAAFTFQDAFSPAGTPMPRTPRPDPSADA